MTPTYTPALDTDRLKLRSPAHEGLDVDLQVRWLNDPIVTKFSEQRHLLHSRDSQLQYISDMGATNNHFWEVRLADETPIGTMTAYMDYINRVADVGILIGNTSFWGNGYGKEAWSAVVEWLVNERVRKIEAGCMEPNRAMTKIFLSSKMKIEAVRKGHFLLNGKSVDMILAGRFP